MRARMLVSWAVVSGGIILAINSSAAWSQSNPVPEASQFAGCPPVLPAEEGERSIVVPSIAPHVEPPAQEVPHVASLPKSSAHEGAMSLLHDKLAQRDQLQLEIAALRESTQTPEQISVRVKIMEVNRTRLRQVGLTLQLAVENGVERYSAVDLLDAGAGKADSATQKFNVRTNLNPEVLHFFDSLEREGVSRMLAAPAVVTTSGRPASIEIGGEIPVPHPGEASGFKSQSYGTRLELNAVALGNNRVRLDVRPRISELDESRSIQVNGQKVPALSVRQFGTSLEMEFGKTTVLSGLVQERTVSTPGWLGRTSDAVEEIALVLVVTPEIVR